MVESRFRNADEAGAWVRFAAGFAQQWQRMPEQVAAEADGLLVEYRKRVANGPVDTVSPDSAGMPPGWRFSEARNQWERGRYAVRVCSKSECLGHWNWYLDGELGFQAPTAREAAEKADEQERMFRASGRRRYRFSMQGAYEAGEKDHPQLVIKRIAPDAYDFESMSIASCWLFSAKKIPDPPPWICEVEP